MVELRDGNFEFNPTSDLNFQESLTIFSYLILETQNSYFLSFKLSGHSVKRYEFQYLRTYLDGPD